MKLTGATLALAGVTLLLVALLGQFTAMGEYRSAPPRAWEAFNPAMARNVRSFDKLVEASQSKSSKGAAETMRRSYSLVIKRFTHKAAQHTVWSNWLLWGMGKVHPPFAHIRNPQTMLQNGYSLLCDQSSYLLLRLALQHGIKARHVGLDGHVVMEAWYNGDWHLYDPDLEVIPEDENGKVLSVEALAGSPKLLKRYYGRFSGDKTSMVSILGSRENNTYMSYPPGAWFEWKSNVLFWFEKLAEVLKFAIPALVVLLGGWLWGRSRPMER